MYANCLCLCGLLQTLAGHREGKTHREERAGRQLFSMSYLKIYILNYVLPISREEQFPSTTQPVKTVVVCLVI